MTPVLVTIGPLSIPSYGAMLLLAFLVGGVSLALELRRRALDPHLARGIVLLAVVFGWLGSKALALAGLLASHAAPGFTAAWRDTIARVLDAGAPALMLAMASAASAAIWPVTATTVCPPTCRGAPATITASSRPLRPSPGCPSCWRSFPARSYPIRRRVIPRRCTSSWVACWGGWCSARWHGDGCRMGSASWCTGFTGR
jgi:hypothetical protein